nr:hypothetical protein [Tanacetum cinerariifolium]
MEDGSTGPSVQPQDDASANIVHESPSPADAETSADSDKTTSGGVTEILQIDEDQGKDVDNQVNLEENIGEVDQGQAGSDPGKTSESRPLPKQEFMKEDQAGPDPGVSRMALARPNPEPTHEEFMATVPNGDALRKCIISDPYKPTTVLVQAVAATDDSPAIPEHTTVETPMNIKFTSHDGESMESYYTRFYKLMNEMIRNNLTVATMKVNVQFLQQLQPEWSRYKGKEIAKPITPPYETASEDDNDPKQAQRDKDMQKNLAVIAKYFKKIYKPTNNNFGTSSNSRNKNVDTTPQYKNDNQSRQFRNPRMVNIAGARENVGSPVVQQSGIQCFNSYTDEEIDEQELEAHYSYMKKIQENDQNDVESDDEHVALANLKLDITKVITDLKLREEHDIDKMLSMEKQLKFLNEIVYKRSQSIHTIHMMGPKVPTYNGRPTFANPRYLKQAQSKVPCLYAFPYDQSTHTNKLIPDGEETLALVRESRSKLNKDSMRPYDYTTLNSLNEIFKPPTQEFEI